MENPEGSSKQIYGLNMDNSEGPGFDQIQKEIDNMMKKFFGGGSNNNGNGDQPGQKSGGAPGRFQWALILLGLALYAGVTSFYKVDSSQEGVVTRFGAFSHVVSEGPHFKLPFGIDDVYKIEVTRIHELQFGFRKDSRISEEQARLESLMLTGDLNVAEVEWILQYRIGDPVKYLFNVANKEKTLRDMTISAMRRVVGDKLVGDVLTTDRVTIAENARSITQGMLDQLDMGVSITKLALQNVTPPDRVKPAFDEVNIARQDREKMINEAKGIYNKIIPEAEGKAKKLVAEAEAYAVELVNHAKGDAEKFAEVLIAYKTAPELTRERLYLETMSEVLKSADRLLIVDQGLKGILPIFGELGGSKVENAAAATGPASLVPAEESSEGQSNKRRKYSKSN